LRYDGGMDQTRSLKKFLIVIAFITILLYLVGVNGTFVYDDTDQIVKRAKLHNLFNLNDILNCGLRQHRVWQNLSFAMNWMISGGKSWSFKIFSLGLHLVNAYILFQWLKKLFAEKPWMPVLTTALFLIHPLQTQSVTYVMGVITLIQSFFYLLAIYWVHQYRLSRMGGLVLILFASLLAKETCMLIPILLFGYDFAVLRKPGEKIEWKKWAIIFAVPFLFFPLYHVLKDPVSMYKGTSGFALYPFFIYLSSQLYYQAFYFVLLFNPTLQSIIHEAPVMGPYESMMAWIGGISWLFAIGFMFLRYRQFPRVAFLILLYFVNYMPTNSVFQMINPFAEYRLYLSNVTLFAAMAWGLVWVSDQLKNKKYFQSPHWVLPSLVLAYFSIFTFLTVWIWRSEVNIYARGTNLYPNSELLNVNLGAAYLDKKDFEGANYHFFQVRMNAGWLYAPVAMNFMITARDALVQGNVELAWRIVDALERDPAKDPLPQSFYPLRDAAKKKMIEKGLSLETGFEQMIKDGRLISRKERPKVETDE
jgi:hypothetical protein